MLQTTCKCPGMFNPRRLFPLSTEIRTPRGMDFRGKKRRPPRIRLGWPRNFKVFHECVSRCGESYTEVNSTGGGSSGGGGQALHSRRVCALLFPFPFSLNLPLLPRALPLPDLASLYPVKNVHEYLTFQRANIQRRYSNFT